jgi:hypothetical protein
LARPQGLVSLFARKPKPAAPAVKEAVAS